MNGKQKGASFERAICKALSLWVTAGKHEDCFWRSAMSGGRATLGAQKGNLHRRQAGDISATGAEGHVLTNKFYVECKHYRDLELGNFLLGRGTLHRFWETAVREAARYDKTPMLIAKQNRIPTLVLVEGSISGWVGSAVLVELNRYEDVCAVADFDRMVSQPFIEL